MTNSRQTLDGLLLIDKPAGISSAQAVARVKRTFGLSKVGHGGTLDPAATGLLPILIGAGTRLGARFLEGDKQYSGVFRLGIRTSSDDVTGEIVEHDDQVESRLATIGEPELGALAANLLGDSMQIPPQISAIHVDGKRAYARVRAGEDVQLAPRPITIQTLKLWREPDLRLGYRVRCSKGTYVRSLARDIAARLGTLGAVDTLRREMVGEFHVNDAVRLDELRPETLASHLLTLEQLVASMPRIELPDQMCRQLYRGDQSPLVELEPAADQSEGVIYSASGMLCGFAERPTGRNGWQIRFLLPEREAQLRS